MLELSKVKKGREPRTKLEAWLAFFKEGKGLDSSALPRYMQTPVMRQAMETLKSFSEKERRYHLYQTRLNSERLESTYQTVIEKGKRRAEAAEKKAEAEAQRAEAEASRRATAEKAAEKEAELRAMAEKKAESLRLRLAELEAKL